MIELRDVNGGYSGRIIVKNISASFEENRISTVIGPNGCGKSTLLKIMSGMLKPYKGKVLLSGQEIHDIEGIQLAKQIARLPQSRNIPDITVEALVLHGRFPYLGYPRRYRKKDLEAASNAMEETGTLHLSEKLMTELSGGERQKVYIAMLLAQNTGYILLDEPITYLDIKYQIEIMELINKLKEKGKTIIMVLHDLDLAMRYSDMVAVIQNGNLINYAPPEDIYESHILDEIFEVKIIRESGMQYRKHYALHF